MKTIIITVLLLAIGVILIKSNAQEKIAPKNGFKITGELKGLKDGTKIYLKQLSDTIAVTKTEGEIFVLEGYLPQDKLGLSHYISIDFKDARYGQRENKSILIHLDNSEISVSGSTMDLSPWGIIVKGSGVHEDLMDVQGKSLRLYIDPYNKVFKPFMAQVINSFGNDSTQIAQGVQMGLWKVDSLLRGAKGEYVLNWIKEHPNSLIGPWFFNRTFSAKIQSELGPSIYAKLSDRVKNSFYGLELKKKLSLDVGQIAPGLILPTSRGKLLSLKDVMKKNKLTLIDFWASWCQPCIGGFPKMKELYAKYHDKGLEIYGLSVDEKKEPWLMELKKQNLPWLNVIDNEKKLYKQLYNVSGFPTYILIDQDGKMLYKHTGGYTDGRVEPDLLKMIEDKLGKLGR